MFIQFFNREIASKKSGDIKMAEVDRELVSNTLNEVSGSISILREAYHTLSDKLSSQYKSGVGNYSIGAIFLDRSCFWPHLLGPCRPRVQVYVRV